MLILHQKKILKLLNTPVLKSNLKRFLSVQNELGQNHYDIIIAGGGMVGTTLACTLGKNTKLSNQRILLLEGSKDKEYKLPETYSNRVVSLNPGTVNLLKDIDAWKHIVRFGKVQKMQVWDGVSNTMITFNEDMNETVALVVENDLLLNAVGKEAKQSKNVKILYGAKVKDYNLPQYDENVNKIKLEDGTSYTCNLLLGCDGANSQIRKQMQVHYLSWNYNQMGVVATLKIKTETPDNVVAWQRFLPTGPIALLPLTNELSSLVWSTTPNHAKQILDLPDDQFVDALNDAIWKTYVHSNVVDTATKLFDNVLSYLNYPPNSVRQLPPSILSCEKGSRAAFPLGFGHSSSYIGKGVALVGDAAHRVHPLAGQGVNLGFGDIICLNKILGEAIYAGSKIENLSYLKKYESERQRHNIPTMIAIEGLHRLYNNDFTPVVLLRSLGLQATQALAPLKRAIISHAAD